MSNKPFAGKAIPVALAREHSDSAWPVITVPTDEARDAAIRDLEAMAALRVTLKCAPEITEDVAVNEICGALQAMLATDASDHKRGQDGK